MPIELNKIDYLLFSVNFLDMDKNWLQLPKTKLNLPLQVIYSLALTSFVVFDVEVVLFLQMLLQAALVPVLLSAYVALIVLFHVVAG